MSRYQSALDSLSLDTSALGEEAKRFLLLACDPFPDYDELPAGFPDMDNSATVVQCVKGSFQVSKPASLAADAIWDAHFFSLPDLSFQNQARSRAADLGAGVNTITVTAGTTPYYTAPLNCVAAATNQTTVPYVTGSGATWAPTGYEWSGVNLGAYLNGALRVVGAGFEVRNVTANLNKQGTVTVYTVPQTDEIEFWDTTLDANPTLRAQPYRSHRAPPGTVNQAMLMNGSRQWEAAEGVYIPLSFSGVNNPISGGVYANTVYKALDSTLGGAAFGQFCPTSTSGTLLTRPCPLNTSGAYFSGLSPTTTLICTWKFYLERAPGPNLSDLAPLATKSAAFEPDVFKLYSLITNSMPPGCKAGDNDAGDWFRGVMGKIADLAPTVAPLVSSAFGIPPTIGSAMGTSLQKTIANWANAPKKNKKKAPIVPKGAKPGGQLWSAKGKSAAAPVRTKVAARSGIRSKKPTKRDIAEAMKGMTLDELRVTR